MNWALPGTRASSHWQMSPSDMTVRDGMDSEDEVDQLDPDDSYPSSFTAAQKGKGKSTETETHFSLKRTSSTAFEDEHSDLRATSPGVPSPALRDPTNLSDCSALGPLALPDAPANQHKRLRLSESDSKETVPATESSKKRERDDEAESLQEALATIPPHTLGVRPSKRLRSMGPPLQSSADPTYTSGQGKYAPVFSRARSPHFHHIPPTSRPLAARRLSTLERETTSEEKDHPSPHEDGAVRAQSQVGPSRQPSTLSRLPSSSFLETTALDIPVADYENGPPRSRALRRHDTTLVGTESYRPRESISPPSGPQERDDSTENMPRPRARPLHRWNRQDMLLCVENITSPARRCSSWDWAAQVLPPSPLREDTARGLSPTRDGPGLGLFSSPRPLRREGAFYGAANLPGTSAQPTPDGRPDSPSIYREGASDAGAVHISSPRPLRRERAFWGEDNTPALRPRSSMPDPELRGVAASPQRFP